MQDFSKLHVWRDAQNLAVEIYEVTRHFSIDERFGLVAQMRRAAVSVSSNIAEGCGRDGPAELARFLQIAIGSVCELLSQIEVCNRLDLLHTAASTDLMDRADMVRRKLIKLQAEVNSRRRPVE